MEEGEGMLEGMLEGMGIRAKEAATKGGLVEEEGREMGARDWVRGVESNNRRENN